MAVLLDNHYNLDPLQEGEDKTRNAYCVFFQVNLSLYGHKTKLVYNNNDLAYSDYDEKSQIILGHLDVIKNNWKPGHPF